MSRRKLIFANTPNRRVIAITMIHIGEIMVRRKVKVMINHFISTYHEERIKRFVRHTSASVGFTSTEAGYWLSVDFWLALGVAHFICSPFCTDCLHFLTDGWLSDEMMSRLPPIAVPVARSQLRRNIGI